MAIDLFRCSMSPEAAEAAFSIYTPDPETGRCFVGEGAATARFEEDFATATLTPHRILGMNSCTAAIDLALELIGVGAGDEVITTPLTCSASNGSIVLRKAGIVWADISAIDGLIDPDSVAKLVTPKTKAIIAVDWAGRKCDYEKLRSFGVPVIEDAAHCLYLGENYGDYVAWSFGPIKHLTTGGYGGALMPPDYHYDEARLLRWHGLDRLSKSDFRCSQDITRVGYRYHMTDDMAVIGLANLSLAIENVDKATRHAEQFFKEFDIDGIVMPNYDPTCDYWLHGMIIEGDRDAFAMKMQEFGIPTSRAHARNDHHTAYARATVKQDGDLPGVTYFDDHQINIPGGGWLSDWQIAQVMKSVHLSIDSLVTV